MEKKLPTDDAREKHIAIRFLVKSDPERYHSLVAHVTN